MFCAFAFVEQTPKIYSAVRFSDRNSSRLSRIAVNTTYQVKSNKFRRCDCTCGARGLMAQAGEMVGGKGETVRGLEIENTRREDRPSPP